jgi:hypothetical protein
MITIKGGLFWEGGTIGNGERHNPSTNIYGAARSATDTGLSLEVQECITPGASG